MTTGELLYLLMTLAAFGTFMTVLACCDHQRRRMKSPVRTAAPRLTRSRHRNSRPMIRMP
jgi:hypothetical protein